MHTGGVNKLCTKRKGWRSSPTDIEWKISVRCDETFPNLKRFLLWYPPSCRRRTTTSYPRFVVVCNLQTRLISSFPFCTSDGQGLDFWNMDSTDSTRPDHNPNPDLTWETPVGGYVWTAAVCRPALFSPYFISPQKSGALSQFRR